MTRYLISFDDGWMTFPEEDLPDVAKAARAVVQEAKDAGVFVLTGGLDYDVEPAVVATDGMVTDGRTRRGSHAPGQQLPLHVPVELREHQQRQLGTGHPGQPAAGAGTEAPARAGSVNAYTYRTSRST